MTTPGWSDEKHGGSLRWLEFTFTVVLIILPVDLGFLYFGALQMEAQRRKGEAPPPGGRGAGVPSKHSPIKITSRFSFRAHVCREGP